MVNKKTKHLIEKVILVYKSLNEENDTLVSDTYNKGTQFDDESYYRSAGRLFAIKHISFEVEEGEGL